MHRLAAKPVPRADQVRFAGNPRVASNQGIYAHDGRIVHRGRPAWPAFFSSAIGETDTSGSPSCSRLGLTLVGVVDDLIKLRRTANGLSARQKFLGQAIVAVLIALLLYVKQSRLPGGLSMAIALDRHHAFAGAVVRAAWPSS